MSIGTKEGRQLTALVIGGSSGIGASAVKLFIKKGVRVVIADINENLGKTFEQELNGQATFIAINITQEDSIKLCLEETVKLLGNLDMVVNTAGVTGPTTFLHETSDADFHKVVAVDLEGSFRVSRQVIKLFRSQEPRLVRHDLGSEAWEPVMQRGSLVNFASSIASVAQPQLSIYCAAKAGVILMSKAMALENADYGIRVNTISPGLTLTPLLTSDPNYDFELAKRDYLKDQPIGRFGHPDEIAAGAVFTAMDGASFMTGNDWGPDGGYHIA